MINLKINYESWWKS